MENRGYIVSRSDIYVGALVKTNMIYRYEGIHPFSQLSGKLYCGSYEVLRSMLFILDDEKRSNDLLYKSPSYPILNFTDDQVCLTLKEESKVLIESVSLADLLSYFGYASLLTYDDILVIRKIFFSGTFIEDHWPTDKKDVDQVKRSSLLFREVKKRYMESIWLQENKVRLSCMNESLPDEDWHIF